MGSTHPNSVGSSKSGRSAPSPSNTYLPSVMASLNLNQPALGTYAHLLPPSWKSDITRWLAEDTPSFDYGGFVVGEELQLAELLGKGKTDVSLTPFSSSLRLSVSGLTGIFACP